MNLLNGFMVDQRYKTTIQSMLVPEKTDTHTQKGQKSLESLQRVIYWTEFFNKQRQYPMLIKESCLPSSFNVCLGCLQQSLRYLISHINMLVKQKAQLSKYIFSNTRPWHRHTKVQRSKTVILLHSNKITDIVESDSNHRYSCTNNYCQNSHYTVMEPLLFFVCSISINLCKTASHVITSGI